MTAKEVMQDIVIGMSDGLTVPFALAAGLSGTLPNTELVVVAGLAEITAGMISMGLGGFLSAKTDADYYVAEKERQIKEIDVSPEGEIEETKNLVREWGLDEEDVDDVVDALSKKKEEWVDFMLQNQLGLSVPDKKRARNSAITIAISYMAGGIVPLFPYMLFHSAFTAQIASVICTLIALFIFGYVKGVAVGAKPFKSAIMTVLVGGIAAGSAYFMAKLIGGK